MNKRNSKEEHLHNALKEARCSLKTLEAHHFCDSFFLHILSLMEIE